ncbi:hypothetical protein W02_22870 [Nitrospira sp. KM1]|uniref:SprT-like domain-containing protein n=1 Tax=Nitrospira sp. KM1 TaxID=1936990 RepID=UPI0013A7AF4A|nr:SprT-like domain-containing protein [Nitrospira sp. KM1]BCA55147.1 hypothetical protein W02_22870 [Nitrospira sp. KM1]
MTPKIIPLPTTDELTHIWRDLNLRYFNGALPSIAVVWSRRLTSSVGMFVSRTGPRSGWTTGTAARSSRREIRMSRPLLGLLIAKAPYGKQELISTLAHEMIHQWQYDVLKRRPNHGTEFLRKMRDMNRDGSLAVTIYHSLRQEVQALQRFAWRCRWCNRIYRRQRRSIEPARHSCGSCRGPLQELAGQKPVSVSPDPSRELSLAQLSFIF